MLDKRLFMVYNKSTLKGENKKQKEKRKMVWKCIHCGNEYVESDLVDEEDFFTNVCPCCGCHVEETRECEYCGELVCESEVLIDDDGKWACPDCYENNKLYSEKEGE